MLKDLEALNKLLIAFEELGPLADVNTIDMKNIEALLSYSGDLKLLTEAIQGLHQAGLLARSPCSS